MAFRFLHAADLHLGSPFSGLALKDAGIADRFAGASREAFTALVNRAIAEDVAFVLIAGDVFDGEWRDLSIGLFFARELARLTRAGIRVFLVKGNHDAESVVTKRLTLPDGVHVFPAARAESITLEDCNTVIHGRSFPERAVTENFALTYPAPVPGRFNIGLLHTSLDGREGHATYAPCTVADLAGRGYDYWALGHIHKREVVNREPWIVFPGNLQGRSVRETGPRGASLVTVSDDRVSAVEALVFDAARWEVATLDIAGLDRMTDLIDRLEGALEPAISAADGRLLALRLRLIGTAPVARAALGAHATLAGEAQAAADRLAENVWLERLVLDIHEPRTRMDGAPDGLDPAALMAGLEQDGELRAALARDLGELLARAPGLPGDLAPSEADLDSVLETARALILERAAR
ncbi:metallophosphoesterase family protein [Segnochrobactraceae bacterium EtOH-i3]